MNRDNATNASRRTLAAIVFTDIVDFSSRVQTDEETTLELARRDLELIRQTCDACGGKVLKTTGDGLLLYFHSAVEAVACAMQSQQKLAELASQLPEDQTLQHRIGIHLGDVFVTSDDVMGDGVNVASRLQAEAPPGGICISQTVYDVVKNRLGVQATYLGPRDLKNIRDAVPVYEILLDAATGGRSGSTGDGGGTSKGRIAALLAAGAAMALLAVIAAVLLMQSTREPSAPDFSAPAREGEAATGESAGVTSLAGAGEMTPQTQEPDTQPFREEKRRFLADRDFAGWAKFLAEHGDGTAVMQEAAVYRRLAAIKAMAAIRLRSASAEDPLIFYPREDGEMMNIWMEGDGSIRLRPAGSDAPPRVLRSLPPGMQVRLMEAIAATPEQREAVRVYMADLRELLPAGQRRPTDRPARRPRR